MNDFDIQLNNFSDKFSGIDVDLIEILFTEGPMFMNEEEITEFLRKKDNDYKKTFLWCYDNYTNVEETIEFLDEWLEFCDNKKEPICALYKDTYDLAYEYVESVMGLDDFTKKYFDYESLGQDLANEEPYCELSSGRIIYMNM